MLGPADSNLISKDLVPVIEQLLQDSEAEVRSEAIAQLPKVLKHANKDSILDNIFKIV